MDLFTWPSKDKATSLNLHTAALCRYRNVALKTCWKQQTIGWSGKRGSEISMLMVQHDDDDDDDQLLCIYSLIQTIYIYIYIVLW